MDGQIVSLTVLVLGVVLGAIAGWFLLKTKASAANAANLATLKERLEGKEAEVQRLQTALSNELSEHKCTRDESVQVKSALEGERRAAQERTDAFKKAADELAERFKALSRDALKDNNESFLDLARSTLERFQSTAKVDLESRQKAIDQLVKPLKDSLDKVDSKIGELEKTRAGAYSELREQVKALATSQLQLQAETGNLVNALRTPARAIKTDCSIVSEPLCSGIVCKRRYATHSARSGGCDHVRRCRAGVVVAPIRGPSSGPAYEGRRSGRGNTPSLLVSVPTPFCVGNLIGISKNSRALLFRHSSLPNG